jgi:MoaA/NifB/PqqE/SkfB family radical SAM enzyme
MFMTPAFDEALLTPDLPFALQLEVTSRCNLRCPVCPSTTGATASAADRSHISDAVWSALLPFACEVGQVFILGFGEPLTNPALLQRLRDLDEHSVKTTLITNGLLISPITAQGLAALRYLAHINVSLDSPDPNVYRAVRGQSLDRALGGLSHLLAAVRDTGKISVSSVMMRSNLNTLANFPRLLAEMGVRHYILQRLKPYTLVAGEEHVDEMELTDQLEVVRSECAAHGVALDVDGPPLPQKAGPLGLVPPGPSTDLPKCLMPWEFPCVDKDGRVFPCYFAASIGQNQLGHVGIDDLGTIWVSDAYASFRRALLDGAPPTLCERCVVDRGPNPFWEFSAVLAPGSLRQAADGNVVVQLRNTGARAWTRDDGVLIGTAHPRDESSPLQHPSWLSRNRTCTFAESVVEPGSLATFAFRTSHIPEGRQWFQAVVEGICWLPNTGFAVKGGCP